MSANVALASDYSDSSLLSKVESAFKKVGKDLLYMAFCLYYAMQNHSMPLPLKLSIMASLAYFVCPVDAIPDFIPVIGYTDDTGVFASTLAVVSCYIDDSVKQKAERKVSSIFA